MSVAILETPPLHAGLARRYAGICFFSHFLFISLSLMPGLAAAPLVVEDAVTYVRPARNLVDHGAFSREDAPPYLWEPYRRPLLPGLIAISLALFSDPRWTLYFAAATAGLAGWFAVRWTADLGGGRTAQHLAGWLLALMPNSLGLSAMLLTDALTGHLVIGWLYLLWRGMTRRSVPAFAGSAVLLLLLQSLKPTLDLAAILILGTGVLVARQARSWTALCALVLLTLPVPLHSAERNLRDHGAFSPTFLGMETVREYLQCRYLVEKTGIDYETMTERIRARDRAAAEKQLSPSSPSGRLYRVKKTEAGRFLREHPGAALRLMATETLRQFAAPQEFAAQIFLGLPPAWLRALGSLLTLAFWGAACWGGVTLGRAGEWKLGLLALGVAAFFLVTGSVSHHVGGRLRFPADVAAVPLAALGVRALLPRRPGTSRKPGSAPGEP